MQKTDVNNTALAIFFIATAVVVIGGLVVIPVATPIPSAYADATTCNQTGAQQCATVGKEPETCLLGHAEKCTATSNREAAEESNSLRKACREEGSTCKIEGEKP